MIAGSCHRGSGAGVVIVLLVLLVVLAVVFFSKQNTVIYKDVVGISCDGS